ncbi:benzoate 4-monooxygenase cytochrome P450 [Lojkania enalia]|uniref:Benzoate 4-monooxygenase cytochrome P450 n=1 Tax=Lojkania enalia TaxID=147567 RepID=A0A9P4K722_9PLEO|nr:benzoate 4-monooxygenase cytochrome P450 [Didymosphaeria enalia]
MVSYYLAICLAIYVAYYFGSAVYYVFFHSLSKYPGPISAKFSGWLSFWHTARGDRHVWLWQLHEVYGPIVRYRYDSVVMSTPEALRTIYDSRANVQKSNSYLVWQKKAAPPNTFSCVDKLQHVRRRKILNAAISDKAIKSAQPFVIKHLDRWFDILKGKGGDWSDPRNISKHLDNLQFDIMAELCYGKSFDTKEPVDSSLKTIPHDISQYMWLMFRIMNSPFVHIWVWLKPRGLDILYRKIMPAKIKNYVRFVEKAVMERLCQEESLQDKGLEAERRDMLHYLFHAKDPETRQRGYSQAELVEEADMLTVAATDTTAGAMAATFFYLSRNESAYQKLKHEVRTQFADMEAIRLGPQIRECKYLQAVINETLRMSPPGANEFPREVLLGGLRIGDEYFPPGVIIGCGFYALFHDQNVFGDPFVYRPERWIVGDGVSEKDVADAERAFAPFSIGTRGCPGKNLALMELSLLFARLLHGYEFRLAPGDRTGEGGIEMVWGRKSHRQYQTKDAFAPIRDGPYIQFAARV